MQWRKEMESCVADLPPYTYKLWQYLKMMASHKDRVVIVGKYHVQVKRGQLLTTYKELSKRTSWIQNRKRVYAGTSQVRYSLNSLKALSMTGTMTGTMTGGWLLITLCKYSIYQLSKTELEQGLQQEPQHNHDRTMTGLEQDCDNNIKNDNELEELKRIKKNSNNTSVVGKNSDQSIKRKDCEDIFNFWNSKKIIKHKSIEPSLKHIKSRLKNGHTKESILECITNYAQAFHSKDHKLTYKWTLSGFLKSSDTLDKFLTENNPLYYYKSDNAKERDQQDGKWDEFLAEE